MNLLKSFYSKHLFACKWFLTLLTFEKRSWFRYMLLDCPDDYVRKSFAELIIVCLKTTGNSEYEYYLDTTEESLTTKPYFDFDHYAFDEYMAEFYKEMGGEKTHSP